MPSLTMNSAALALAALAPAACSQPASNAPAQPPATPPTAGPTGAAPTPVAPDADLASLPPVEPPAPGTPGGLPDDRTPVSEAPFTPTSAQGAADVVQTYYALIGEKKYAEAWTLWSDGGKASGQSQAAFVDSFKAYHSYNAQVGGPGQIEGAAGSLYVEVPVVIYGRKATGEELHLHGKAQLRRVNDVDGSTAEQRRWHIAGIDLQPSPKP